MTLVPHHGPSIFASACAGCLRSHMDGSGQGVDAHDELGNHDMFLPSMGVLLGVEDEAPVPPADILDTPQTRGKGVRHSEQFEEFLTLVHAAGPHNRPREDRPLAAFPELNASPSIHRYARRFPDGVETVNDGLAVAS